MSNALKSYFAEREKVEVAAGSVDKYSDAMDRVIPEIVEDMKKGEQLAAELRYSRTIHARGCLCCVRKPFHTSTKTQGGGYVVLDFF